MYFIFVQFYLFFSSLRVINTFFDQFSLFFHFGSFEISFQDFQWLEILWKFITVSGVPARLFSQVCTDPRHHLLPARLFFPACLGLFQKSAAKVPVCLPKMQFFNRPWAYIRFACEKFLPFAKYVGLCKNKPVAVPTNRSWL